MNCKTNLGAGRVHSRWRGSTHARGVSERRYQLTLLHVTVFFLPPKVRRLPPSRNCLPQPEPSLKHGLRCAILSPYRPRPCEMQWLLAASGALLEEIPTH